MSRRRPPWSLFVALVLLPQGCESPVDPHPGEPASVAAFMHRPFQGDFPVTSLFDHDLPISWDDANGIVIPWWGTPVETLDGHKGYDWAMPEGTPLLAAASGIVTRSGLGDEVYCPPLGRSTRNRRVVIVHTTAEGQRFAVAYAHTSSEVVAVGDAVTPGQLLAYSGNTGCSLGPHLHFQVEYHRSTTAPGVLGGLGVPAVREVAVDPYGWAGSGPDPWALADLGAPSALLWLPGEAPVVGPSGG
jgi:murein DD-endopeptidase MepM/ murein hydrolase activator NlpD